MSNPLILCWIHIEFVCFTCLRIVQQEAGRFVWNFDKFVSSVIFSLDRVHKVIPVQKTFGER
jgi:hypothetical protein